MNNGTYIDKDVRLTADITEAVTIPVGTDTHPFTGTFDGQGHTLNVNITDTENQGTAPFRYIYGTTIQNVKTTGTVNGTMHCAGLVGFAKAATDYSTNGTLMVNTIRNCEVAATITFNCLTTDTYDGYGKYMIMAPTVLLSMKHERLTRMCSSSAAAAPSTILTARIPRPSAPAAPTSS